MLKAIIRLLRPRQWIKNGFVLAPLLFSGAFVAPDLLIQALSAAVLFCLVSSAAYIVNDLRDVAQDRLHPVKSRRRPLANGELTPAVAVSVCVALLLVVGVVGLLLNPRLLLVLLGYFGLMLAYSYVLKYQPVLDIFTIALGFVMRIYAGAVAIDVQVSAWMFVTTLSLALYLAAIKRRQEFRHGNETRTVLAHYSETLVQRYAEMAGSGALVFYSLFVVSERQELIATVPLVLYGLFRYWYVVEILDAGESPADVLFKDWQLALVVVLWIAIAMYTMRALH